MADDPVARARAMAEHLGTRSVNDQPARLSSSTIPIGTTVELRGLQAKPELNGQRGVVTEFIASTGRCSVQMESGGEPLSIKPHNMKAPSSSSSSSSVSNDGHGEGGGVARPSRSSMTEVAARQKKAQAEAAAAADRLCANCSAPARYTCSACKDAHYCGSFCSRAHWKHHKIACKRTTDMLEMRRTIDELRAAMGQQARQIERIQEETASCAEVGQLQMQEMMQTIDEQRHALAYIQQENAQGRDQIRSTSDVIITLKSSVRTLQQENGQQREQLRSSSKEIEKLQVAAKHAEEQMAAHLASAAAAAAMAAAASTTATAAATADLPVEELDEL